MAVSITKNGQTMFIVSTSKVEILDAIINEKYPKVVSMFYDVANVTYHLIADYR